jgi:hypothetical protein
MHYSDRDSQYASQLFHEKPVEYGTLCLISRKGTCWDTAPTESWFSSFRIFGERFATKEAMKTTALEHIEGVYNCNRKRLHCALGYTSPIQFLKEWLTARREENQILCGHSLGRRKPGEPHTLRSNITFHLRREMHPMPSSMSPSATVANARL